MNDPLYLACVVALIRFYHARFTGPLISRFLMDLQATNSKSMHQESLTSAGSLSFNAIIGSLGSSAPALDDEIHHTLRGSYDMGSVDTEATTVSDDL